MKRIAGWFNQEGTEIDIREDTPAGIRETPTKRFRIPKDVLATRR
jgi:hypothetical protein